MTRKLILAALLAITAVTGVALTPAAAGPPTFGDRRDHDHDRDRGDRNRTRYVVLVRHRGHWHEHGVYRDRDDAQRVERFLERRGLDAKIERVRGR